MVNKELILKIYEALATGNIQSVSPYIDENIKWNIVGMPVIYGRNNFLKIMKMLELECSPGNRNKKIIAEGDYVVVESPGNVNHGQGKSINPSYCEIFLIKNGKVKELTSYIVDAAADTENN